MQRVGFADAELREDKRGPLPEHLQLGLKLHGRGSEIQSVALQLRQHGVEQVPLFVLRHDGARRLLRAVRPPAQEGQALRVLLRLDSLRVPFELECLGHVPRRFLVHLRLRLEPLGVDVAVLQRRRGVDRHDDVGTRVRGFLPVYPHKLLGFLNRDRQFAFEGNAGLLDLVLRLPLVLQGDGPRDLSVRLRAVLAQLELQVALHDLLVVRVDVEQHVGLAEEEVVLLRGHLRIMVHLDVHLPGVRQRLDGAQCPLDRRLGVPL
mmetsp:Transcript_6592/g.18441  ORF Transcript_6592/g.18441 Transcript_6592/m.18441 type:complete len:263 (+) Transcript_6592:425-1213(+)